MLRKGLNVKISKNGHEFWVTIMHVGRDTIYVKIKDVKDVYRHGIITRITEHDIIKEYNGGDIIKLE
jgi:hypothetical protein